MCFIAIVILVHLLVSSRFELMCRILPGAVVLLYSKIRIVSLYIRFLYMQLVSYGLAIVFMCWQHLN